MIEDKEFDVSEMAIVTYLQGMEYGQSFTAIPAFPLRSFPHGAIVYNVNSGVESPKDLVGKKIGVRAYAGTAGVWVRGLLQSEYGVDPASVEWVVNDIEHIGEFKLPSNVQQIQGANLGEMVASGEIAAAIGLQNVDSPNVKPLIANARQAQADWFKKTGVFPINNTVVIQNELLSSEPWVAESLLDAFKEAKAVYLKGLKEAGEKSRDQEADLRFMEIVGEDPLPIGVGPNRDALNQIVQYCRNQKLIQGQPSAEDLFTPTTRM
jgi:4,5-dihydroxyphthalate decarboxylase